MYVCICNALRKTQIEAVARNGAVSVEAAYAALDSQIQCGSCRDEAHDIIAAARCGAAPQPLLQAAE
jgi:bacterioferritin-associated ferredoxin